jgi:tetratricopeptide (TPR) repeat protein
LVERGLLAGRVIWFYLGKLVWPADLTFIYPRWEIDAGATWQWLPPAGVGVLVVGLWFIRARSRGPLAAFLLFVGSLFPVLGFFNVYPFQYSFVADHFVYLPSLAVIALVAAGLTCLVASWPQAGRLAAAAVLLATCGGLVWTHCRRFRDNETLFRITVQRNPVCWMAHNNLGKELLGDRTRLPEAIACFERALQLRPDYFEAHNNLGLALTQAGRPAEAVPHLEAALRLKPAAHQAHNNLGIALAGSGRAGAALEAFRHAAALNPASPNIQENWGKALLLLGRQREAEERFAHAARLRAATPPGSK